MRSSIVTICLCGQLAQFCQLLGFVRAIEINVRHFQLGRHLASRLLSSAKAAMPFWNTDQENRDTCMTCDRLP